MKQIIRYAITLCLFFICNWMRAQDANILSIADVSGSMGSQVAIPINLNNTCNDIVAAQFRLTLSDGLTLNTNSVQFSVRASNHAAVVQKNGNSYIVMVFSSDNSVIAGNAGQLMTIVLNIPTGLTPGGEYPLTLSEVLLSNKAGENVLTSFNSGVLHIAEVADFIVTDVQPTIEGNLAPGDAVNVRWTVKNQGGLASTGGWSEQISLVGSNGRTVLLGTVHHDEALAAGATVSRQADVLIPSQPGIDGAAKIQVKLLPNADSGEMTEYQANNTTQSSQTVMLSKNLILTIPQTVVEGGNTLKCVLTRSGSWGASQTFNISVEGDGRLGVPATVTIPRGQSSTTFYITVNDDAIVNTDNHFIIQASGNDYEQVSADLEMEDNEYPALNLTVSNTYVTEGDTFQLTVKRNSTVAEPLTVMLTCEESKHFDFPTLLTIPAGEESVTIIVRAIDDADLYDVLSLAFVASAEKHVNAEEIVVLTDNDMPELQLTFTPQSVSENAGINAVIGVLRRVGNLDSKITVRLTDNSNGLLTYSSQTLTLKKGEKEVKFGVGVTDDLLVNGDREVTVTAAVYVSSCNCYSTGETSGSVSQKLTVLDNDGPTLLVTPSASVFLEGSENNSLTISRNAYFDTALTVTISSDFDTMLSYNHTTVIEAGQTSVTIPVAVSDNDVQGDDHAFTFTVTATGFTKGTCWSMVSDQSLPDAIISDFSVSNAEAEAESEVTLAVTIKNAGNSLLQRETPVTVYLNDAAVLPLKTERILSAGEETTIEATYTLPAKTGSFSLTAVVNPAKRISELLYTNNSSATLPITIVPCLNATAQADKDVYQQGEAITISGKATGTKGANAKLEIYLLNEETRQTITTTTDAEGNYTVAWTPLKGQAGHFVVGACYPGEGKTDAMDEFDVYGINTSGFRATCQFGEGDTYTGRIYITNPGVLPQTGIHIEPQATSDNCEFTFSEVERLEGGRSATITYSIKGNGITQGYSWQQMPLVVKSNEGSTTDYKLYYYVMSQRGSLRATTSQIKTTMTLGVPREYPLTIWNAGKGETGTITLALPSMIESVTPRTMPSLASGDSVNILLRFIPTEQMRANVPVSGKIGINCSNGYGLPVYFELTPVSEAKGTLTVDVVDDFTYYTAESPHVSNAKVKVVNRATRTLMAEGLTADNGCFTAEMNEGVYTVTVEADNHLSQTRDVVVDPGTDNKEEVFLSYDAITYEWKVEETTVDDEYSVETIVKFDTRVPQPVVVVSYPDECPEPGSIFPVTVTNKGFINANDVGVELGIKGNGYTLEFLNNPNIDILAPQQSVVFYAKIKLKDAESRRETINPILVKCVEMNGGAYYTYDCGPNANQRYVTIFKKWGRCSSSDHSYGGSGGGSIGGVGSPWKYGSNYVGNNVRYDPYEEAVKLCQEKEAPEEEKEEEEEPDEIPDEEPDETDDCDEKPTFHFVLTPNVYNENGKCKVIKNKTVIADGNSYRIILNPLNSKKPSDDCKYTYHWDLFVNGTLADSDEYGRLLNRSALNGAIYIAPDDFPVLDLSGKANMTARLTYKYGNVSSTEDVDFVLTEFQPPVFKLVAVDEKPDSKAMKGVAADGVSQIKIVLDPSYEKPLKDFDKITWSLAEEIGTLENFNSLEDVIYTAPANHPDPTKNVHKVSAKINYVMGKQSGEETVEIEVTKVPVLMVHGLASAASMWHREGGTIPYKEGMFEFLNTFWLYTSDSFKPFYRLCNYEKFQLYALDYSGNALESFNTNKNVVESGINHLIDASYRNDYVASKVDIVTHSMGGLLTKLFIQTHSNSERDIDYRGKRIHKFITINTPHAGSQLGDFLNDPRVQFVRDIKEKTKKVTIPIFEYDPIYGATIVGWEETEESITPFFKSRECLRNEVYGVFTSKKTKDIGRGAVKDLSVESEAILNINNDITSNVKCHAVVTASESALPEWGSWYKGHFVQSLGYEDMDAAFYELYRGDRHDWIVPVESQEGGLNGNHITFRDGALDFMYCHIASCKNNEIKTVIANLLSEDINNSSVFSDGFNDISPLSFNMPSLDNVYTIYTPDKIGNPEIHPDYENWKKNKQEVNNIRRIESAATDDSYLYCMHTYENGDSLINIEIKPFGEFTNIGFACFYNDISFAVIDSTKGAVKLPLKIDGSIVVLYEGIRSDGSWCAMRDTIAVNTIGDKKIEKIEFTEDSIVILTDEYFNPRVLCLWSDGMVTEADSPELSIADIGLAYIEEGKFVYGKASGSTSLTARYGDLECSIPLEIYEFSVDDEDSEEETNSVCVGNVSLKIEQRAVMTRQAFRGTLTVNNGHPTLPLSDMKVNIEVRDANGTLATAHEFQMEIESLSDFSGNKQFDAGWTLSPKESGTANILFIPTKYAAPTEPQEWSFGGSFSYTDPYTSLTVTRELNPVTLTVNPTPVLDFTYFMQRDILGDDPLTEEIEPMEPAEFAIIVNNKGYGSTQGMKMTTDQPQIVENEKGLAVNFEIISTQMNGQEKTLALGQSMTTDFGTIAPLSQAYAQWWLQSTLLGHFVEYDIKATHVTSHNNPDLSLLDQVTIHELIHGFTPESMQYNSQKGRGFLVNDVEDTKDLPDEVYFTDGTQQHVAVTDNITVSEVAENSYALHVTPAQTGWNYGSVADPTNGRAVLKGIVRQSDGTTLPLDNIWQTDRTLRDGKDPLYEYRLHFVAEMAADGEDFVLTFEPKPDVELAVDTIIGLPDEGVVLTTPLESVQVRFNKPIDVSTFTTEDLTLNCQSKRVPTGGIQITKVDDTTFDLNLTEAVQEDGFYTLTIQTADITDAEGFNGFVGKQAIWTQFGGQPQLKIKISPEDAGTVNPTGGRYDYDSEVTLTATPAEGYTFAGWSTDNETLSTEDVLAYRMTGNAELTALFTPKHYEVQVDYDEALGKVENGGTGFYDYNTHLCLVAKPGVYCLFKGWTVDGETIDSETLNLTVTGKHLIKAEFVRDNNYILGDANGDGTVSIADISAIINRINNAVTGMFLEEAADVNGDGIISIADVTGVINIINK